MKVRRDVMKTRGRGCVIYDVMAIEGVNEYCKFGEHSFAQFSLHQSTPTSTLPSPRMRSSTSKHDLHIPSS